MKIVEAQVKQVGNLTENANRDNPQRRRVYDTTGISPTLCEQMGTGGNLQPFIVASRGRNKINPSDRTTGNEVEQRLEPNSKGICNTLTSVQKDNYVLEPLEIEYRNCADKLGKEPVVCEMRTDELRMFEDNVCGTLRTIQEGGNKCVIEPTIRIKQATAIGYAECKVGGVADLSFPNSTTRRGRVQDNGDTSPTLMTTENGIYKIESPYRIRKLTPKEAWRLMGFSDLDFFSAMMQDRKAAVELMEKYKDNLNGTAIMREAETMQKTSNTQLYRQAGNSICVPVLENIFRQLF